MKRNVGGFDRTFRFAIGLALILTVLVVHFTGDLLGASQGAVIVLLLIGAAIALGSAGARYCPINAALGRDTRRVVDSGDGDGDGLSEKTVRSD